MKKSCVLSFSLFFLLIHFIWEINTLSIDNFVIDVAPGLGRRFDGVGAISGGGATSKLLMNYPEPQRSDILDLLFKPNHGASLQILKVEIGGDAQSSEGTESSHMHEEWDESYQRGYEWWLMVEAKKRNKDIRLCALAWGFPGWLGHYSWDPYEDRNRTADYIFRWIWAAKKFYDLDIDCVGIWNEKPYDIEYIKILRRTLDTRGFSSVKIIAADLLPSGSWTIVDDMLKDPQLNTSIDIIGGHYTGGYSSPAAQASNKPLWSSEDWSSPDTEEGAGCMARLANQNYINGYMTSLIAWSLIVSYYADLPFSPNSLMAANQPWSGFYEISPPIWATAHTTQFTEIGWTYLKHGYGVGKLRHGGTIVSYLSPDHSELTIVIETMNTEFSGYCLRPPQVPTKVVAQNVTLILNGTLSGISSLQLWRTRLRGNEKSEFFLSLGKIQVSNGRLMLALEVDSIYTLTTLLTGTKAEPGKISPSKPFPLPYFDDMEAYAKDQEAFNFAQQVGAFEVRYTKDSLHKNVLRQVVLHAPIHWCPVVLTQPVGVIGNFNWSDIRVEVDIFVPKLNATTGVFIAARMDQGGCTTFVARGVFFFLLFGTRSRVVISNDYERTNVVFEGKVDLHYEQWYRMALNVKGNSTTALLDGVMISTGFNTPTHGFVALGTDNFGLADFDNLAIKPAA